MTATAITFMITMVTVWGGLVAAIVNLARHPESADSEPDVMRVEL